MFLAVAHDLTDINFDRNPSTNQRTLIWNMQ